MKKVFTVGLALVSLVFLLSNFTLPKVSNFVMMVVGEEPVLPIDPYAYDDAEFPEHLFNLGDDIGYGGGGRDTFALSVLDNDKATLGRVLFYDKKLSAVEDISCGSCHLQELSFAENKSFSEGVNSETRRNSMHLNDLGWSNADGFTWDMRETDLHEMIIIPLTDENEIGANIDDVKIKLEQTSYYPELFSNAYGDGEITEDRIVDALVQFITSMTTFNSRFDQQVVSDFSEFTEQEMLGLELFSLNCTTCHTQGSHTIFGEDIFFEGGIINELPFIFNNGLPEDPDDAGAGEWSENLNNLFKVPTLRNIELTAPYMHDGRFSNLEEVIDHYSDEAIENEWTIFIPPGGFGFNDEEKEALLVFLETLTDDTFISNPRWSDPFANALNNNNIAIQELKLAPNPTSDIATISFANDKNNLVSINILNSSGMLVKHDQFRGSEYQFEKGDFSPGMYTIQLIMGDQRSVQKLIVN